MMLSTKIACYVYSVFVSGGMSGQYFGKSYLDVGILSVNLLLLCFCY